MKYLVAAILILALASSVVAQDRVFARTYQSNVVFKGHFDLEYWTTLRTGKVGEYSPYAFGRHLDNRFELEFGLGKNIQTSFYFNTYNFKYVLNDSTAQELPTQTQIETSFSNTWKFKLSDPVANTLGSALYLELTAGSDEYEIEGKVILDKRFLNDLFALNLVGAYELETEVERDGKDTERDFEWKVPVEIDMGYMHFFSPTSGVGLEMTNYNAVTKSGDWEHSVLFAGPSWYFNQGQFFGVLNALAQIGNLHKTDAAPGNRERNAHEDFEFRLLIGYSF